MSRGSSTSCCKRWRRRCRRTSTRRRRMTRTPHRFEFEPDSEPANGASSACWSLFVSGSPGVVCVSWRSPRKYQKLIVWPSTTTIHSANLQRRCSPGRRVRSRRGHSLHGQVPRRRRCPRSNRRRRGLSQRSSSSLTRPCSGTDRHAIARGFRSASREAGDCRPSLRHHCARETLYSFACMMWRPFRPRAVAWAGVLGMTGP